MVVICVPLEWFSRTIPFSIDLQVSVSTKSAKSDKQFVWEGEANTSSYTIREELDSDKLIPRGTSITLHLKVFFSLAFDIIQLSLGFLSNLLWIQD